MKSTKQTDAKKFCHDTDKKQTNVAASGIKAISLFIEMDVDSYLSPIPCKTPGVLWSRYSKMNNNNDDGRIIMIKEEHDVKKPPQTCPTPCQIPKIKAIFYGRG